MNEQEIVSQMITFIEEKERQLQNSRLAADNQQRNNVVQSILDELERVTEQCRYVKSNLKISVTLKITVRLNVPQMVR